MFNIPILFLVFNRPEETAQSFEMIKKIKPTQLFIAADGPRLNIQSDFSNCEEVRVSILNFIDWDCDVKTLFRDENLGCGKAVQSALDWFFEQTEMGIIIEDDIIPDLSFFTYAENLLHKFKDNHTIFSINGCSLAYENFKYDYGLTKYFNMWGWATWRRSNDLVHKTWSAYDRNADLKKNSVLVKALKLNTIWPKDEWYNYWFRIFKDTYKGEIDTWDYQWVYTCLKNQKYAIRPNLNRINNIGFSDNSTHTSQAPHIKLSNMKVYHVEKMDTELKGEMIVDLKYERQHVAKYWKGFKFNVNSLIKKVIHKLKKSFFKT
nr:nucleotide-diphospho-sugar transferase [uncultured Flavobacterium sp.]